MKKVEKRERVFIGWRLTNSKNDLLSEKSRNSNSRQDGSGGPQDLEQILMEGDVPKTPSNQLPSLFNVRTTDDAAMRPGLKKWVDDNVNPKLLLQVHDFSFYADGKPGKKRKGEQADTEEAPRKIKYPDPLPPLHCPSLKAQGVPFRPYSDDEKDILLPRSFDEIL